MLCVVISLLFVVCRMGFESCRLTLIVDVLLYDLFGVHLLFCVFTTVYPRLLLIALCVVCCFFDS